jgi:MtfA peptidase
MFEKLHGWWDNWRVNRSGYTVAQWESAVADWPVMDRYQDSERAALCEMAFKFLVRKSVNSGGGFQVTDFMRLKIATMACVPVLKLGLDWYDYWYSVILYEDDFVANHLVQGDDGVVHMEGSGLSGEAWYRGPVILSWQAVCEAGVDKRHGKATNVVIHELAHKLDMLRDGANGAPPMHPDMRPGEWHRVFTAAWDHLQNDWQHQRALPIDEYGLSSPAEFFAVCSETFFEAPAVLKTQLPQVYSLLCQFYRQQPQ